VRALRAHHISWPDSIIHKKSVPADSAPLAGSSSGGPHCLVDLKAKHLLTHASLHTSKLWEAVAGNPRALTCCRSPSCSHLLQETWCSPVAVNPRALTCCRRFGHNKGPGQRHGKLRSKVGIPAGTRMVVAVCNSLGRCITVCAIVQGVRHAHNREWVLIKPRPRPPGLSFLRVQAWQALLLPCNSNHQTGAQPNRQSQFLKIPIKPGPQLGCVGKGVRVHSCVRV